MKKLVFVLAFVFASHAFAQVYPGRAVKVVVPWPPGQATDIAARIVADKVGNALGQPFVIDNRPGAGGAIGTDVVAKSAPDGYTLLAASSGPLSIMPNLQKVPYDPLKDLAPISLIAAVPFALVTHPSFPAANASEFVALLKANPGKYTFASSGTGATAHLFAELFNSVAGIQARHVPYKGTAPAMTDIMNGQVSYAVETVGRDAAWIADQAGFKVPAKTRVLITPIEFIGLDEPLSKEKLCPVLAMFVAGFVLSSFDEGDRPPRFPTRPRPGWGMPRRPERRARSWCGSPPRCRRCWRRRS